MTSGGTSLEVDNNEIAETISELSPHADTEAIVSSIAVNAYPNPFVDHINVNLEIEKAADYQVQLYSPNGQLIKSYDWKTTKGYNEQRIEMQNLPNGMYMLSIKNGLEIIDTQTIMKF